VPLPSTTAAPKRHDPALDGLRGLAVLMVFVFHYGGGLRSHHTAVRLLGYLTETGWTGVVLFFALSGFLITGGVWDSLQSSTDHAAHILRNFYARRALRILPLYYAALLASAIVTIVRGSDLAALHPLAIFALFLQNLPNFAYVTIHNTSPLPLYHLWSLAVEEQFYLLWPALLLLARTRRAALHLSLWSFVLAAIFRLIFYGLPCFYWAGGWLSSLPSALFDTFLLTQCGALALGAAFALAMRSQTWDAMQRWASPVFFAGLSLYLLSSLLCRSFLLVAPMQYIVGLPGVSLAAAALLPILLRPGIARTTASFAPLAWLGRISYGFYVFHILLQPIYDHLAAHLTHADSGTWYQTVRLAVALPLTVLAAWLSYRLLERPFLRAKRRFPLRPSLAQPGSSA
jgi:peptidoglycan/LPS O-acetylase OafA/YrhL